MKWKSISLRLSIAVASVPCHVYAGAGVVNESRWPSKEIPYVICDCSVDVLKSSCSKLQCLQNAEAVKTAITLWNTKVGTSVKLVAKSAKDKQEPHLLFVSQEDDDEESEDKFKNWCYTTVGYSGRNEAHLVVIGDQCSAQKGTRLSGSVLHEIGHAIGLHHEQQRTDRDEFLKVTFPGSTANDAISQSGRMCAIDEQEKCEFRSLVFPPFRIYTYGRNLSDYDLNSIMHYPLTVSYEDCVKIGTDDDHNKACLDLTTQGKKKLNDAGKFPADVGQREGLSSGDIKSLQELYN